MIRVMLMVIVIQQSQANLVEDVSSILHIKNKIVITEEGFFNDYTLNNQKMDFYQTLNFNGLPFLQQLR